MLNPRPRGLRFTGGHILPLNRFCPEWHLSAKDEASWKTFTETTLRRRFSQKITNHFKIIRKPLQRLTSSILQQMSVRSQGGKSSGPVRCGPESPGVVRSPFVFRTPIWWVRGSRGEPPFGLQELCMLLPMPCYLLPGERNRSLPWCGYLCEFQPGLDCGSLRAMCEVIEAVQPFGPVIIAGLGSSCQMASQTAAGLAGRGMDVKLLLVHDSTHNAFSREEAAPETQAAVHGILNLAHHLGVPEEKRANVLRSIALHPSLWDLHRVLTDLQPANAEPLAWATAVSTLLDVQSPRGSGWDFGSSGARALPEFREVFPPTASVRFRPSHSAGERHSKARIEHGPAASGAATDSAATERRVHLSSALTFPCFPPTPALRLC